MIIFPIFVYGPWLFQWPHVQTHLVCFCLDSQRNLAKSCLCCQRKWAAAARICQEHQPVLCLSQLGRLWEFYTLSRATPRNGNDWNLIWLVVWNMNSMFPYIGNNHPNWRTHIELFRGFESTNQLCCISILAMNREWTWTSHYLEHCLMVVEEFDQRNYHVAWRWLMSSRDCRAIFWLRSAQLLKHSQQIAIFDALICWYLSNVVSWLVARFAIVAIIFQIIPNCIVWKVHYCGNIIWFQCRHVTAQNVSSSSSILHGYFNPLVFWYEWERNTY